MSALAMMDTPKLATVSVPYFAYGSNLSRAQMRARCPGARYAGRTMIGGYRLAFAGYSRTWGGAVATLVPARGGRVPGILYELPPPCIERLDAFEGHPHVYVRVRVRVTDDAGRVRHAQTYAMPITPEARPSPRYLERLAREYVRHGFALAPLFDAALGGAA
jgi:cation transport regulator ChaC